MPVEIELEFDIFVVLIVIKLAELTLSAPIVAFVVRKLGVVSEIPTRILFVVRLVATRLLVVMLKALDVVKILTPETDNVVVDVLILIELVQSKLEIVEMVALLFVKVLVVPRILDVVILVVKTFVVDTFAIVAFVN